MLLAADPRASASRWSSTRRPRATARSSSRTSPTSGVDIANGGWGKGSFLRWNRARNDVDKAGQGDRARRPASRRASSCPGRRLDAFDQYYSHRQKQKLVRRRTHTCGPRTCPTELEAGKVYVLDGRDRDPTAMEVAVADLDAQFEPAGLRAAPLGELR